jgi:hypothetical protein
MSLAEELAHGVDVSELIDDGATASIQQEVVGLIPVACAFENFGGHKGAGFNGPGRDVAADFLEHASHVGDDFSIKSIHIKSVHLCSLGRPTISLGQGANGFGAVENIENTTLRVGRMKSRR